MIIDTHQAYAKKISRSTVIQAMRLQPGMMAYKDFRIDESHDQHAYPVILAVLPRILGGRSRGLLNSIEIKVSTFSLSLFFFATATVARKGN